jgi:hypothetical protein
MSYQEKYIKYKNKYLSLKYRNIIGGGDEKKYSVIMRFEDDISDKFTFIKKQIYNEYNKSNPGILEKKFSYAVPHITLVYGPNVLSEKIEQNREEYTMIEKDIEKIKKIYPGLIETFSNRKDNDIKYINISTFESDKQIVIKSKFKSDLLDDMFKHFRDSITDFKNLTDNVFKTYDDSSDFFHSTIAIIKKKNDDTEEIINEKRRIANEIVEKTKKFIEDDNGIKSNTILKIKKIIFRPIFPDGDDKPDHILWEF